MKKKTARKIRLHGFNNLTKTLSFNIFDICYAAEKKHRASYFNYLEKQYNAARLTAILKQSARLIGAKILNIAEQDYAPCGSSATLLICDQTAQKQSVVSHLDKSHITVHTYPESHPDNGVCTFRADIDISSCGKISPLKTLNYLLTIFKPHIAILDYRIRGFTRDVKGHKHFIDHKIQSIQDFINQSHKNKYLFKDVNLARRNMFHTRLLLKEFDLRQFLVEPLGNKNTRHDQILIARHIRKEMLEIYRG